MAAPGGRILHLDNDQQRALREHRQRWQRLASSAGPTDREEAERALAELYAGAGLARPEFRWFDSPLKLMRANLACTPEDGDNVWHSIGGLLGERVWRTLWQHVDADLGVAVWDSLKGTLWQKVER